MSAQPTTPAGADAPSAGFTEPHTVVPDHDLVASHAEAFKQQLRARVEEGHVNLVIDLGRVTIIDSKGLAVLMLCHRSVSSRGGGLTVVTGDPDLRQLLRVTRMDQHMTVIEPTG